MPQPTILENQSVTGDPGEVQAALDALRAFRAGPGVLVMRDDNDPRPLRFEVYYRPDPDPSRRLITVLDKDARALAVFSAKSPNAFAGLDFLHIARLALTLLYENHAHRVILSGSDWQEYEYWRAIPEQAVHNPHPAQTAEMMTALQAMLAP